MAQASRVVVVVLDGLRPDMVTPALMPHLAAFAHRGAWFREARSVFPSMTRVATSSIATGAPPSAHGIVGNTFYYPEITRAFVLDTSLAADISLAEATLGGPLLTAPTFADALSTNGRSFAVVHSGSPGSAYAINPRVAGNNHWTFSIMGEDNTRTPHAVRDMVARFGPLPERNLPRYEEIAYATRVFCEHVLADTSPDVALIWYNEPDTSYHYKFLGTSDTLAVLARVDAAFGEILAAIARRPDAADIAVIAASDHGQISSSALLDMSALLTAAGHPASKPSARSLAGAKVAITAGNMGEIRILDGDMTRRDAIARWLMDQSFIGMVFTASDDPVLGSVPGTFSSKLVHLDHARAPELTYVMRSSIDTDPYGLPGSCLISGGVPAGGGMHGGLNRHELNTVLVLGGAAARTPLPPLGCPAGIIDIAPTILDLLGVAPLAPMAGRTLLSDVVRHAAPAHETFETGQGTFRQTLTIARRDGHAFPVHGGRVG